MLRLQRLQKDVVAGQGAKRQACCRGGIEWVAASEWITRSHHRRYDVRSDSLDDSRD